MYGSGKEHEAQSIRVRYSSPGSSRGQVHVLTQALNTLESEHVILHIQLRFNVLLFHFTVFSQHINYLPTYLSHTCLLYTSDAADDNRLV